MPCASQLVHVLEVQADKERKTMDDIEFLDDNTRPEGPRFENLTPAQRLPGRHLAMIHDHFRQNMQVLRELMQQATGGEISAEELKQRADTMPLLENYRRFGALCGQHCQIIEMHHSIEDQALFPELKSKSDALRKVVERLMAEHEIVHELLLRLINALTLLVRAPSTENFAAATEIYETLERVLLSHFGYEEEEIGDALGVYDIPV